MIRVHEVQGQGSQTSGNRVKRNYINGRMNHMELSTTLKAQEVVFGPILINSIPATVLLDPSSLHSFISSQCVVDHKMLMLLVRKPMLAKSPRGR
jgi:hypothetical protein